MSEPNEDLKSIQDEIRWVDLKKNAESRRDRPWSIYNILVPAGCLVTAGVLANGIYHMCNRNSKKQQRMMRYRVLAQGVTIVLASVSLFQYKFTKH